MKQNYARVYEYNEYWWWQPRKLDPIPVYPTPVYGPFDIEALAEKSLYLHLKLLNNGEEWE